MSFPKHIRDRVILEMSDFDNLSPDQKLAWQRLWDPYYQRIAPCNGKPKRLYGTARRQSCRSKQET